MILGDQTHEILDFQDATKRLERNTPRTFCNGQILLCTHLLD